MNDNLSKKIFLWALLLSLLFHALFILIFMFTGFSLFNGEPVPETPKKIFIKLKKPAPPPQPEPERNNPVPEQYRKLTENPDANLQRPDNTPFISDKNSVSSAPEASSSTVLPSQPSKPEHKTSSSAENQTTSKFADLSPYKMFTKGTLTGNNTKENSLQKDKQKNESANEGPSGTDKSTAKKAKIFDPKQVGTFALSTYEWEYAPYMTAWLRYLQQHWIAPPAYTQLGLIHGTTYVKFKIFRDGHMEDLQVLAHEGHQSLQTSSTNAVEASFPFKPLPDDFPDDYLEITLKMLYPDLRRLAAPQ